MQGYLLVKPKGYKAEKVEMEEGVTYTEADYKAQVKTNLETQAVIDQVVTFISERNFRDFPAVNALMEDAADQLGFALGARQKAMTAAAKEDWQNAMLWANQWWQYQVKNANIRMRAKSYLEEHGAEKVQY
jgi:nitrous-oxide reductase